MKVYEGYNGMLEFEAFPEFAEYILQHHLLDYIKETLRLSYKMELPLLKYLDNWTEEQLIEHSLKSTTEFLTNIVRNKAKQEIGNNLNRWVKDQVALVGKYDIAAEDISLIVFIRNRALKKFFPGYSNDGKLIIKLSEEIDSLSLAENVSFGNTYINILKDKINREVHFNTKLAGTSPGLVYVFDLEEEKFIYTNKKAAQLLGYDPDELKNISGSFIENLAHSEDLPRLHEHLKSYDKLENGEVCSIEYRLKDSSGGYKWMRNYETVFKKDNKGRALQIIGTAFDISKEKQISDDLERRSAQLMEAQAFANIGSFDWNFKTLVENNTEQYYKILEIPEGNYEDFIEHIHPDDKGKFIKVYEESLKTGKFEAEYRYITGEKEKYLWSRGVVLFDENGEPEKITGTLQDISDRRKIEEILLQKTLALEKSNADLLEFTYVASHDLKEPLRKISLYSDMILAQNSENLNQRGKENFLKIRDASKRMQRLIDDLLTLSSVSADKKKEMHSLQAILEEVLSMLELTIKEKGAVVHADGLPEAPVIPSQFRQLFLNLIGNALKFCKKDVPPEITVEHCYLNSNKTATGDPKQAAFLQLSVTDNGIGFKDESAEKIFLLFQRLHNKADYDGTGLGLAICKRITDEHNGTITASSRQGMGATFTITFPIV